MHVFMKSPRVPRRSLVFLVTDTSSALEVGDTAQQAHFSSGFSPTQSPF